MDDTLLDRKKTWIMQVVQEPAIETSVPAWEMIEAGRYMPRRTRGSFPGRELG
jgi:hypothetical protein